MSGIVGIVELGGRPASKDVLSQMARQLEARAPDGGDVWVDGPVALAHAHLKLMPDAIQDPQPLTLDGQAWIVADARLDNREELNAVLGPVGCDAALILAAYRHYGEGFVEHLEGDFAFAIWDPSCGKLFCVRDHLGVCPFYFISLDDVFLFSTDIEALKQHPRFRPELDEGFIADFLYFGAPQEPVSTVFRQIRRLPAASMLVVTRESIRMRSYWSIDRVAAVRYRDEREYLDHFSELFEQSIHRRILGTNIGIYLSGGMDSGSIAAVVTALNQDRPVGVHGFSVSASGLLPEDEEDRFTQQTAEYLGIPVSYQRLTHYKLFASGAYGQAYPSEPVPDPDLLVSFVQHQQFKARNIRTVLTGEYGDAVFAGSVAPLRQDIRAGAWLRAARDIVHHVRRTGTMRGLGLRSMLTGRFKAAWEPTHPDWIEAGFARRTACQERWTDYWRDVSACSDDRGQINRLRNSNFFSLYEALRMPYRVKHPFLDLRLMTFLLGIPSHQKLDKVLLRTAMEGRLPESIVRRPKTSLRGDQIQARIERGDLAGAGQSRLYEVLAPYIDCDQYFRELESRGKVGNQGSTWNSWFLIHPWALSDWLCNRHMSGDVTK